MAATLTSPPAAAPTALAARADYVAPVSNRCPSNVAPVVRHGGVAFERPTRLDSGADHWSRVWHREPDATRDDAALAREAGSRRWAAVLSRIDETFGGVAGLRCIELGAGRGDASALLARRGARVTLLDYCETALLHAQRRFHRLKLDADFVHADLCGDLSRATTVRECSPSRATTVGECFHGRYEGTKARRHGGRSDEATKPQSDEGDCSPLGPLADGASLIGAFDLAISYGVVEHFKGAERTRAIAAHRRVLGDHGLAVISVPHAACPTYRLWKTYLELRGWWPYGMEIPYSRRELTRRVITAGFARAETRAFDWRASVAEHLLRGVFRRPAAKPDPRPSILDNPLGPALVAFAWAD